MTESERQQLRSIGLSDKAIDTLESMGCEIVEQTNSTSPSSPTTSTGGGRRSNDPSPDQLTVDDVLDLIDQEAN